MRILYISDRGKGGIKNHVRCLLECLKGVEGIETYCIGEDEPFAGKSGHDFAEWKQIRRVIKTFKPDLIHFHTIPFFMGLYVKGFVNKPVFVSVHTKFSIRTSLKECVLRWFVKGAFYLPVSKTVVDELKKYLKSDEYEVFYNPVKISKEDKGVQSNSKSTNPLIIGLVGRNAEIKDWPSFLEVAHTLNKKGCDVEFWGVGIEPQEAVMAFGEKANLVKWKGFQLNGREWISKMDIFVLTSQSEQMPTVVLEAFAEKTAICGFIPDGGMREILEYSNGSLREVFIKERNIDKLSQIVAMLILSKQKRASVVEDGWQIVTNHFDAVKNCRGQLLEIYRRFAK